MIKGPKQTKLEDLVLARGLAPSLHKARGLIMAGQVVVNDQRIDKPGQRVPNEAQIRLKGESSRYVGRGGDKLAGAFEDFGLTGTLTNMIVLDVGASTGGFTDACLQAGAKKVFALDVGTNQLAWSLRQNPQVVVLEKTDIRQVDPMTLDPVDWIVVDVSFISLTLVVEALLKFAQNWTVHYLLLVKPQFELPREDIPKGGVVNSDALRAKAVDSVKNKLLSLGVQEVLAKESRLPGREGNREVFLHFSVKHRGPSI